jgi:hypothetical protein
MIVDALVSIGGYDFPEPSTYSAVTSTIVDSARNVQGRVTGSIVRSDVAKIELSWKFLSVRDWATILTLFNNSFYNDVRFFNQATGSYDTRTMYVSDRDASIFRRDPNTGTVLGWVNPKLSLVEV